MSTKFACILDIGQIKLMLLMRFFCYKSKESKLFLPLFYLFCKYFNVKSLLVLQNFSTALIDEIFLFIQDWVLSLDIKLESVYIKTQNPVL